MSRPPSIAMSLIHDVPEMLDVGKVRKPCVSDRLRSVCGVCVTGAATAPRSSNHRSGLQNISSVCLCQSVPETVEREELRGIPSPTVQYNHQSRVESPGKFWWSLAATSQKGKSTIPFFPMSFGEVQLLDTILIVTDPFLPFNKNLGT